jgi:hypothetical protein
MSESQLVISVPEIQQSSTPQCSEPPEATTNVKRSRVALAQLKEPRILPEYDDHQDQSDTEGMS